MPKSYGQKLKILYIARLLTEHTDEEHPVSTAEIISYLETQGIHAERKSIYDDIHALQNFGLDIIATRETPKGYYLASREFELAELKLLVDAVQASKFVTEKKTRALIAKLETLTSHTNARQLHRQVVVAQRGKSINEQIYYSVDTIYAAMASDRMIRFLYCEWSADKQLVPRRSGAFYEISPWLLTWEDENYYLIAYDHLAAILKYYRVDKMLSISICEQFRMGSDVFETLDIAGFAKKTFGMFAGDETMVTLRCDRSLAGVMIDRFGTDVAMRPVSDTELQIHTSVAVSPQFFGWLAGFGNRIRIISPAWICERYHQYLQDILSLYDNCDDSEEDTP